MAVLNPEDVYEVVSALPTKLTVNVVAATPVILWVPFKSDSTTFILEWFGTSVSTDDGYVLVYFGPVPSSL